jgi:hypothetical protein
MIVSKPGKKVTVWSVSGGRDSQRHLPGNTAAER